MMKKRLRSVLCMALSAVLCMSFLPAVCADAATGGAEEAVGFISGVPDGVPSGDVTVSFYAANPTAQAADYVAAVAVYNGSRLVDAATATGSLTSGANMETPLSTLTVTVPEGEGEFQCKPFFWYADNMEPIPLLSELPTEEPTEEPTEAPTPVPTPVPTAEFTVTSNFENADRYLYRVGNGNNVKLGSLFETVGGESVLSSNDVNVSISSLADSGAGGTYNKSASDWTQSTIRFSGQGPVAVTVRDGEGTPYTLNLEVVTGNNATAATNAVGANIVLLNDVHATSLSVSNGKTLYGNGFAISDVRTTTATTNGLVNINNGTLNNVQIFGYEATTAVTSGTNNEGYAPIIHITGNANIYNSYISGGRYAIMAEGKSVIKDTMIDGGAIANLCIASGDITLENVTTTTSTRGGLKGLGIQVSSVANTSITIDGYLKQHNWLTKSEVPSPTYQAIVSDLYENPTFAYKVGDVSYLNLGILFAGTEQGHRIPMTEAQAALTDNTGNDYGYFEKTAMKTTGTLYTAKASMGSAQALVAPTFVPDQYCVLPSEAWDFTAKNYIAKTLGSNEYCYYDSITGKVNISFLKETSSTAKAWDPMILTLSKFGNVLPYTVSMNGVDYTDENIIFAESGDYTVTYTYTDPYNYDRNGAAFSETYTKTVKLSVKAVDPNAKIYEADFLYVGSWANDAKKAVINNYTYVMPDVSETSSTIGKTTVGGQTVYFPIVTVSPTDDTGNTPYENGKGYYFSPVFNALNITDYDQANGEIEYTYNVSSDNWPHEKNQTNGPDRAVFGYASGAAFANQPYARSMNASNYGYGKNDNGLCYTSNDIEKDNSASTHLVQYHYVSNDGTTYYYYIQYSYTAMTYTTSSCFAKGTVITMADGSEKAIEEITRDDRITAWDMMTGAYAENDIAILIDHGEDQYDVVHLEFSDGTLLRIIGEHGVFDYDQNEFVYITEDNCSEFLGHRFVQYDASGDYALVTLQDAYTTSEITNAYSITSAGTMNAFAERLLTVAPPREFYNWIPMGDTLRYDTESLQADIEEYGLYTYDDFKDYVTEEQFEALGGAYLKIPVEKGMFTFDTVREWIRLYGEFFL